MERPEKKREYHLADRKHCECHLCREIRIHNQALDDWEAYDKERLEGLIEEFKNQYMDYLSDGAAYLSIRNFLIEQLSNERKGK